MQKMFYEVNSLDKRCYEEFALSEDILMEHAASCMASYIENNHCDKKSVLIVCGSGNNGADGIALARLLYKKFEVNVYLCSQAKSQMAILQKKRAKLLGVSFVQELSQHDIIVDCIFGTGLNKPLSSKYINIINILNSFEGFKLSCDIPSGVDNKGCVGDTAFYANITITMGALKTSLYTDSAKDYVGEIIVADLGVQREVYELDTNVFLLDRKDLKLPLRDIQNSHKGTYGHLNVLVGEKKGAGIIAAKAAFAFGVGLVSAVCHDCVDLPYHIMQSSKISDNCTAIALGMGLGKYEDKEIESILSLDIPTIIDADLLHDEIVLKSLHKEVILTPHPREFCSLLRICGIADISIETLQKNRFEYVEKFSKKYPKVVLVLKGANVIIAQNSKLYVNSLGSSILAKGGSGDVLSGLIASLLAQEYKAIDAAISASLAHALAAQNYKKNNYSLIPSDLIEEVRKI